MDQRPFGRRAAPPARLAIAPSQALDLNPAAEAFRAGLSGGSAASGDFHAWRRSRRGRRLVLWGLRIALICPGLIAVGIGASNTVAGAMEVAGVGLGFWIRGERKRELTAIASWEDGSLREPAGGGRQ